MGNDQAGATRSVSWQDPDRDPRESNSDPLLDHLARATLLLALEVELKAFVRARNSHSGRGGTGMSFAAGRFAEQGWKTFTLRKEWPGS
jgi:hypothetical protein